MSVSTNIDISLLSIDMHFSRIPINIVIAEAINVIDLYNCVPREINACHIDVLNGHIMSIK